MKKLILTVIIGLLALTAKTQVIKDDSANMVFHLVTYDLNAPVSSSSKVVWFWKIDRDFVVRRRSPMDSDGNGSGDMNYVKWDTIAKVHSAYTMPRKKEYDVYFFDTETGGYSYSVLVAKNPDKTREIVSVVSHKWTTAKNKTVIMGNYYLLSAINKKRYKK